MNIKVIYFCFLLIIWNNLINGQELHDPSEILKILESSKITYNLDVLDNTIEIPDFSENLNYNDYYRIENDSGLFVYSYALCDSASPYFDKAEEFFSIKNLDSALVNYEKVLEIQPNYYKVMTYIGQMYGNFGDLDTAIEWYKKTISLNYIDYLAHYLLADIYRLKEDYENAINEITIARILNRNNPRMAELQFKLYEHIDLNTDDWYFNPQYILSKDEDGVVDIKMDFDWMGYALTKAVWAYEPGYKQSMGVNEDSYSSLEDKEALIVLYIGLINEGKKAFKKNKDFQNLQKAIEDDYLTEFILYEIMLPNHPNLAYYLNQEQIEKIKNYLITIRHNK